MKATFRGSYNHNIDAKGRICMPVKFREALGDRFVVTRGFDGCLYAFTPDDWNAFDEQLQELSIYDKGAREVSRFFSAGSVDAEPDKQGRFQLSAELLNHADIKKEAVVVGVGSRIEIWSKERWEDASTFENIEDIAANMSALGLKI
ncbi:MAG: division/cell wall cluster transcriptional repressor MraZ [Lachnospiraceae bacterium]|nr:division/cell wall cluster transcriptional repressor MraZ [Lachnospiraceae bacterium]